MLMCQLDDIFSLRPLTTKVALLLIYLISL